jgi:hypothetical protein
MMVSMMVGLKVVMMVALMDDLKVFWMVVMKVVMLAD